jgi:uncharacterized protein (DUF1697 family)
MARQVVLLRGINIGPKKRVAMPKLREVLKEAGYEDVQTYVQSGNVVLSTSKTAQQTARAVEKLIKENFGLEVPVIVRTKRELSAVVKRNPLEGAATEAKRYQVTFFEAKPDAKLIRKLNELATAEEKLAHSGREVYAWHPKGVARSKLWVQLARTGGTSRNWTTVTKLLELAAGDSENR